MPAEPIELGIQLAAATGLIAVVVLVHGLGLIGISRMLKLGRDDLEEREFGFRSVGLMCAIGLSIFALHVFEIWIFAAFYLATGALGTLEEALYYSGSAYATLGRTAEYFPDQWRLLGAVEALAGFLLIGWSTAFLVRNISRITPG
ncbi:MAG: hypothetical protein ACFBQW_05835 [Sphingomonadaceae bacterium]